MKRMLKGHHRGDRSFLCPANAAYFGLPTAGTPLHEEGLRSELMRFTSAANWAEIDLVKEEREEGKGVCGGGLVGGGM